jgi:hypothetical protein
MKLFEEEDPMVAAARNAAAAAGSGKGKGKVRFLFKTALRPSLVARVVMILIDASSATDIH